MVIRSVIGILALIAAIWVIYDVLVVNKRLSTGMKVVWIILALLFSILTAVIYYLFGRNNVWLQVNKMVDERKKTGFWYMIKSALDPVPQIISASIVPPITDSINAVMKSVEDSVNRMQNNIVRMLSSVVIIGLGGIFLIFSLFFYLVEFLLWSRSLAFVCIGLVLLIIGLLFHLKKWNFEKITGEENEK